MPYNFSEISDYDLKLFFTVINDLEHKASLMGVNGPLKFSNTPKGVSRDEQMAILSRLDKEHYLSFSNDGKSVWLNEKMYADKSFGDLYTSVHKEYHQRFDKTKSESSVAKEKIKVFEALSFDEKKSQLNFMGYRIQIARQDEPTVAHGILNHIFNNSDQELTDQFFFSEIADAEFGDLEYTKKPNAWKRYYIACKDIQEKIRTGTPEKIDDFLQFNTGQKAKVLINPKYL
jgi:hypothetical protein